MALQLQVVKPILPVLFSLFVSAAAQCQIPTPADSETALWLTAGQWNGRFWKTLNANEKNIFLFGYSNGFDMVAIITTTNFEEFRKVKAPLWPMGLTIAEVKDAIDNFYATPENSRIGIANALTVIAKKASGADEESVQKAINNLRQRVSGAK